MRWKESVSGYNDEYHRNVCEALYAINRAINNLYDGIANSGFDSCVDTESLNTARDLMWAIVEREEEVQ